MEIERVNLGEHSYDVVIGSGAAAELKRILKAKETLVVTDENVDRLYGNVFSGYEKVVLKTGEENKNFNSILQIISRLMQLNFSRDAVIVAFGGGIVGDTAGFAASIYMRGIKYYGMPTTLLSMVDSSVGGKTAVNYDGIKNIIGTFHQAKGVFIDTDYLASLEEKEWLSGIGEIVKTALLDRDTYALMSPLKSVDALKNSNVESIIKSCVHFKAEVVSADEHESGRRKILNLGHTFGHAYEAVGISNSSDRRHGEYVLLGLLAELNLSKKLGLMSAENYEKLKNFILPYVKSKQVVEDKSKFFSALTHDKKNKNGGIGFVLLTDIASTKDVVIPSEEVQKLIDEREKLC